jgi:hypothetical protein
MTKKHTAASKSNSADSAGFIVNEAVANLRDTSSQHNQNVTNGIDRHEMIAMAAYYRSQKRGFNNGDEIQGWLEAEAEIDGSI